MSKGQKNPRFKAVLFDLDGTLIEFKFKFRESRIAIIEWLKGTGFRVSHLSPDAKTQSILDDVKKQLDLNRMSYASVRRSIFDILDDFEFKTIIESKPHAGSLELLQRLKHEQILTALVTNSGRRPIDTILGSYGFLPYLSMVISRDEMEKMKPEPEGLLRAINVLDIERNDAVYVGDSVIDIQAARRAGITSVALSHGVSSGEMLAREEPDFLISKIEEVEEIVFS